MYLRVPLFNTIKLCTYIIKFNHFLIRLTFTKNKIVIHCVITNKMVVINSFVIIRKQKIYVSQTIVIETYSNIKCLKYQTFLIFQKTLLANYYNHVFYNFFEVFINSTKELLLLYV